MVKKVEKIACHSCLEIVDLKKSKELYRNNYGIPHYVMVCQKCYKDEA